MKKRTREGKKQQHQGKKDNELFSIFNNNQSTGQKRPERKRRNDPWISKEQRNQILRSLHNGEEIEIK